MTAIHITAGLLALIAGAVALYASKGGALHRRAGKIFVCAMLCMSGTGAVMAVLKPERLSVIAGALTFYLVTTGLLTVRRRPGQEFHWAGHAAMVAALAIGIVGMTFGLEASRSPDRRMDGFPAAGYFIFGAVALLAGLLDMRMLRAHDIQGAHRLARHLWRMGFSMFVATSSFFLGQPQVFPEAIRQTRLLAIPVLLVIVTTLYWLVRVLWKRGQPRTVSFGEST